MSTVGYGDFYPKTLPGKIIAIQASIIGVVLVSLLMVAIEKFLA